MSPTDRNERERGRASGAPRDAKGRFTRADEPVLHRAQPRRLENMDGLTPEEVDALDGAPKVETESLPRLVVLAVCFALILSGLAVLLWIGAFLVGVLR